MRFDMAELHPRRNTMQSVDSLLADGAFGYGFVDRQLKCIVDAIRAYQGRALRSLVTE